MLVDSIDICLALRAARVDQGREMTDYQAANSRLICQRLRVTNDGDCNDK